MSHITSANDAVETIEIVEFTVGNKTLGIPIDAVQEIIHRTPVTSIPFTHRFIKGMVAVKGEVLSVLNLEAIVAETSLFNASQEKMMVIQCLHDNFVIHVDQVTEIKIIRALQESQAPYIKYEVETDRGLLYILHVEEILAAIQQ